MVRLRVMPAGRPSSLSSKAAELIKELRCAGTSIRKIAEQVDASRSAVHHLLKRA